MITALNKLSKEEQTLAKNIALGEKPGSLGSCYLAKVEAVQKEKFWNSNLNYSQLEAIEKAMKSPFFLIQGPPGTGKTKVVAELSQFFSKVNHLSHSKENYVHSQVMCCGPTNKSVDVIAEYLREKRTPFKLVRIYSEKKEQEEFPLPNRLDFIKKIPESQNKIKKAELKDISLHHMIRNEECADAKFICKMDKRIHERVMREKSGEPIDQCDDITEEELQQYRKIIEKSEKKILKQSDIILVTCTTSGASRIKNGCNIEQVIIDECGMCKEPESLIPIVQCKPKQVILVGDHQQLNPIVREKEASRRGLIRSLFQRYASCTMYDIKLMLNIHYRMHEDIAAFPSKQFYHNKLTVGHPNQQQKWLKLKSWPDGSTKPIAFVHVIGKEESLAVATEEGGVQSKSNKKEINLAVDIVNSLVHKDNILEKDVAILSMYRAQCTEINKELVKRDEKFKKITVQTVVSAQGSEWEYVILSTVRSLPQIEIEEDPTYSWKRKHLGFICDPHQINVALTRSKNGLIIIGNEFLLKCDETWAKLLEHYRENKAIFSETDLNFN